MNVFCGRPSVPVARGFIPDGLRSGPNQVNAFYLVQRCVRIRAASQPSGINPLTTKEPITSSGRQ
jgi:hypothetical protein